MGVLETVDEVTADEGDASARHGGDESSKEESFIVNLHGLPFSATLEDVTDFLEGLIFKPDLQE